MIVIYLPISLILLYLGGNFLLDGSISISKKLNISKIFVSVVIIGFGTSSPEFAVSLISNLSGNYDISFANIIGSNITNLLFILGIAAILSPILVKFKSLIFHFIILTILNILLIIFGYYGVITKLSGLILLLILSIYLLYSFKTSSVNEEENKEIENFENKSTAFYIGKIILSIVFLTIGSDFLVKSILGISKIFNISESIITLTIVAFGTSIPELVSIIIASKRGEHELIIGNILGSNIFNAAFILGVCSVINPILIDKIFLYRDLQINFIITLILFFLIFMYNKISKKLGFLFLLSYIMYNVMLFCF